MPDDAVCRVKGDAAPYRLYQPHMIGNYNHVDYADNYADNDAVI